jgi:hypothetical protein
MNKLKTFGAITCAAAAIAGTANFALTKYNTLDAENMDSSRAAGKYPDGIPVPSLIARATGVKVRAVFDRGGEWLGSDSQPIYRGDGTIEPIDHEERDCYSTPGSRIEIRDERLGIWRRARNVIDDDLNGGVGDLFIVTLGSLGLYTFTRGRRKKGERSDEESDSPKK